MKKIDSWFQSRYIQADKLSWEQALLQLRYNHLPHSIDQGYLHGPIHTS